jgi:triacylglycerol lipase
LVAGILPFRRYRGMKQTLFFLSVCVFLSSLAFVPGAAYAAPARQNDCPIILVNAALAWGRGEFYNYLAWGGNECDIQEELKARGYMTHTVGLGPYSSTWDRACELYAQVKGGTVDYGLAHSRACRHARYGRTYPGFYPQWGEFNPATGKINKVHLVGHCFGGLTVRYLPQMLEEGIAEERAVTPASDLSPLFAGGNHWVLSATSIVSPHDGTTVLSSYGMRQLAQSEFLKLFSLAAFPWLNLDKALDYDLKLDQWGFTVKKGETMRSIISRLVKSGIVNKKDFCNWDMDPWNICWINSWVHARPDVYYFSQAAEATWEDPRGFRHPIRSQLYLAWPLSEIIGTFLTKSGPYVVDAKWLPNDGTVNTISMSGPKVYPQGYTGKRDEIVDLPEGGTPRIGKWNYLGVLKGVDHFDVVGVNFGWHPYDPLPWWLKHVSVLGSLPDN